MSGQNTDLVLKHVPGTQLPFAAPAAHYVLVEFAAPFPGSGLRESVEDILGKAMDAGLLQDAVIAGTSGERASLWRLREEQSEAQKRESVSVKNDVSVPVSKVPEFITRATAECERRFPGVRVLPFGHLGDGNIHFNVLPAVGADAAAFLAQGEAIMDAVNSVVRQFDGSFSAEHGIGRLKPSMMAAWRGGAELATMHKLKAALDPPGVMNPGKVLPPLD
jgi:FAD/FMN-containing dehydrogenase